MIFDIRTIYFLFSFISLAMALTLFFSFYGNFKKGEGMLTAVLGMHSVSTILIALRNILPIPEMLSVLIAQLLISGAFSMSYMTLCRFYDLKENLLIIITPVIFVCAAATQITSPAMRVVSICTVATLQHLVIVWLLVRIMKNKRNRAIAILLLCNFAAMFAFAVRAVSAFVRTDLYSSVFSANFLQASSLIILLISVFFFNMGFLLLHMEREEYEIKNANMTLDEQNTLLQQNEIRLRETAEELVASRDQAMAASRAKSEFLANMSHEIRTPMNAVLGFTELLGLRITDPEQRRFLEIITINGKTLLGLINDILDLSKIEADRMVLTHSNVNVAKLAKEILELFSTGTDEKKLDFSIDLDPSLPEQLRIDELRLRQIMFNLIGNAVKFTARGGIILTVKTAKTDKQGFVDLTIRVKDSGAGIAPEDQDEIFEAFIQKNISDRSQHRGTGLGLTITKRLVEMMGGSISVRSEPGVGSEFTVVLPGIQIIAR